MRNVLLFSIFIGIALMLIHSSYAEKEPPWVTWDGEHHGKNHPNEKNCKKSDTLKEFAKKVDIQKCGIDNIKNYKSWNFYKLEDKETQKCIKFYNNLGNSLSDYEVMDCFKEPDEWKN